LLIHRRGSFTAFASSASLSSLLSFSVMAEFYPAPAARCDAWRALPGGYPCSVGGCLLLAVLFLRGCATALGVLLGGTRLIAEYALERTDLECRAFLATSDDGNRANGHDHSS
jgi:hypothetical protein